MKTFKTLLKNELKLNVRDMNMVIFAIIMPLVVLIILGVIYNTKPAFDGAEYTFLEQSIGALCAISICAGGLMGLPIVVSEYRERKILKRFKVTPISPVVLLGVEFAIYVIYALVSILSMGMMVGGIAKNAKIAGVIASLLYFPMLVFSGTTLPFEVMPGFLQKVVTIFPLTHGIQLMKATSLGLPIDNLWLSVAVMVVVTIICTCVAVKCFKWE